MTYYDRNGRRVPAPRHDVVPSNGYTAMIALVAITLILGIGVWVWLIQSGVFEESEVTDTEHLIAHDSMTAIHTYDGETIRFYVMTDPDTQLQYIVNDRGGMCLREFDND